MENFPNAKLLLNNKDTQVREVRPTLYNLDGQILELPPVQVEAQSFRLINLREFTDFGGNSFRQGSIKLFHLGKDLAIGMQIYLEDEARSLSFEEKLLEIGNYDSRRLEGVWFQPSNQTETKIVLTNTSEEILTISATVSRRPRNLSAPQTFILQPHQTRLVDLRETFGNAFANSDAVGIALTHNGTASALLARAMVSEPTKGYSTVVTLSNPNTAKSNELHGAGLRLGAINNDELAPTLILRNTNDEDTTVKVHLPYTRIDGTNKILRLADVNLRGQEIKKINLNEISQIAASGQVKTAGIEIKYQAGNGSVVAQMQSISQSRRNSFRVLLWDAPAQRSSTGGYPWLVEGNSSTKAYIKNVTDEEQNYVSYLTWENGGMYMIGMRKIAPHQTIEIDVRKLRDEQTPDEEDRVIPFEISKGQIQWAFKMGGVSDETVINQISLVGQMEQTDTTKGISTSYFCQNCCEEDGFGAIEPGNSEVDMGSVVQYESYEDSYSCYGGFYRYRTTDSAQWSSSNQNVATISSPGRVTTVGVGTTNIKARFNVTQHYVNQPCYGGGDLSPEESGVLSEREEAENTEKRERVPNLPAACDCVCVYPQVSPNANLTVRTGIQKIQYQEPNTTNFIDITNTLYILKGTAVTFKAIPNPANATFPSGQPTWSGTSGATGTGQTKSVTFNTKSTSTTDYKTVIASTGTPKIVNVIVYELTGTLMPKTSFLGRSQERYGVAEEIDLNFTSSPILTSNNIGGLTWRLISGLGTIPLNTNGVVTYTAPDVVSTEVIKIEVVNGPSKGNGITYTKSVVAPTDAVAIQTPNTNIAHTINRCSVGFLLNAFLLPTDVSFSKAEFLEGEAYAVASGYYARDNCPQPPLPPNPTCAVHPLGFTLPITNCNIATGCFAFQDVVDTNGPPPCTNGDFVWDIPWNYIVGNGSPKLIIIARHHQYTTNPDKTSIEKKGVGPFTKKLSDPTTY